MGELTKTSLLIIASILTGVGGAVLGSGDKLWGIIMLVLAVGVLVLRGFLKKKGIPIEAKPK